MIFNPNSTILFVLAGLIILFVIAQSAFFMVRAIRRGKQLGITSEQVRKTIVSQPYLPSLRQFLFYLALLLYQSFWG